MILLGDRHDQAQVGLDEGLLGLLALDDAAPQLAFFGRGQAFWRLRHLALGGSAGLDGLGQADLVVLGQQRVLTDIRQVEANEVLVVTLNSFLGQDRRQTFPFPSSAEITSPGARTTQPSPVPGASSLLSQCKGAVNPAEQQGLRVQG